MSIWNLTVFYSLSSTAQCRNSQHFILSSRLRVSAIYSFAKIRIYSMKHCRISCDCSLFSILDLCPQWTFNNNKLRCFFLLLLRLRIRCDERKKWTNTKMNKNFFYLHYESSWWDWFRWNVRGLGLFGSVLFPFDRYMYINLLISFSVGFELTTFFLGFT